MGVTLRLAHLTIGSVRVRRERHGKLIDANFDHDIIMTLPSSPCGRLAPKSKEQLLRMHAVLKGVCVGLVSDMDIRFFPDKRASDIRKHEMEDKAHDFYS